MRLKARRELGVSCQRHRFRETRRLREGGRRCPEDRPVGQDGTSDPKAGGAEAAGSSSTHRWGEAKARPKASLA